MLNRTLLERQLLARRESRAVPDVVGRLVALQGQQPNGPYIGLWSRVAGFRTDALSELLHDRSVVRSTVMRRTVHLVRGEDFRWLRPTVQPIVASALRHPYFADEIDGLDLDKLASAGTEILRGHTLARQELGRRLVEHFPGRHPGRLADAVEIMEPLVHGPEAGEWGRWRHPAAISLTIAEEWIGRPMAASRRESMIRRYLAGFGPASIMDMQAWSGLTRLREVVDGLRPTLRVFTDEHGKELFDLPDAPLADADGDTPVRFLPAFDNALLGHRDRTRIISEDDRRRIAQQASGGVPTFLVDGFVRGTWSVMESTVRIAPFRPLSPAESAAVEAEADLLRGFIGADDVAVTDRTLT